MLKPRIFLQRNGFFVECGAFDGMSHSTTFLMERKLDWTGLLIEAEPTNFHATVEKHRNAILVPACLSLSTKPKMNAFHVGKQMQGKIVEDKNLNGTVNVQCIPLYSVLLAVNRTTVDVFCLDIEGNELDVLKTIPFDKVDIKVKDANMLVFKINE
jgi:FkbM family methyltransferase